MSLDVVELREFYINPLGRMVRRLLRARLRRIWPSVQGETVLALGYGTPLLRPWLGEADALLAMMPGLQGAAFWPREGPNMSCLADMTALPLDDESVNRVVVMHALEAASDTDALLKEVWRVLKGNGRALFIVPNRRGLWAHSDQTPFGTGQPYSTYQLRAALRDQGFLVARTWRALVLPPWQSRLALALAEGLEKYASWLFPGFGGLLLMEAEKQVYTPVMTKARAFKHRLVLPLPFPMPSGPLPT
jgi:SAM-dependent methyltransferase